MELKLGRAAALGIERILCASSRGTLSLLMEYVRVDGRGSSDLIGRGVGTES